MTENENDPSADQVKLTCEIVAAYVAKNTLPPGDVPDFIKNIHASIANISNSNVPDDDEEIEVQVLPRDFPELPPSGLVTVRKSLSNPEFIVSMIDGKPYKMLARQLTKYGITGDEYRKHFKLPADYPMVAPAYSQKRREYAFQNGLGNNTAPKKKR